MPDIGFELLWIAIAAIVYWLWLILSALNVIAYGILKIGAGDKITGVVGANLAPLTLVFLATIGTLGILQSLTLKVADDKFRTIVLADISKVSATHEQRRAVHLAGKLAAARGVDDLRNAYMALMTAQRRSRHIADAGPGSADRACRRPTSAGVAVALSLDPGPAATGGMSAAPSAGRG